MAVPPGADSLAICASIAQRLAGKGWTMSPLTTPIGARVVTRGVNKRVGVVVDRERQTAVVLMVVGRTGTVEAVATLMGDLHWR